MYENNSIWDFCSIEPSLLLSLKEIENSNIKNKNISSLSSPSSSSLLKENNNIVHNTIYHSGIDGLQVSLSDTEESCRIFMEKLDNILITLKDLSLAHDDITGRTNTFMLNCEYLLEQQHSLQTTGEKLKNSLGPFNDVEEIASLLGIPLGSSLINKNLTDVFSTTNNQAGTITDPRSPEFQSALTKLSKAVLIFKKHPEFLESELYQKWLTQLQNRAISLVARSMKDLLENSSKICIDQINKSKNQRKNGSKKDLLIYEDQPLESSPIYQKFRGLGFRMRELTTLLYVGASGGDDENENNYVNNKSKSFFDRNVSKDYVSYKSAPPTPSSMRTANNILSDIKQNYASIRNDLLKPFLKNLIHNFVGNGSSDVNTLCPGIRHAYSILLRVTQLEYQLVENLFGTNVSKQFNEIDSNSNSNSNNNNNNNNDEIESLSSISSKMKLNEIDKKDHITEVQIIIESICNSVGDSLRPWIIRESDVDELCRVVTTLGEDVREQMIAMNIPKSLLKQLLRGLDHTLCDAQERLSYCAESRLRQDIQLFEPLPSQLSYPDILENFVSSQQNSSKINNSNIDKEDSSTTWYPPLRHTLSLLSKLYGVVEMPVFEDFARRSVVLCVETLKKGSEGVKRNRSQLHSDLFLVRHLLVLREQLIPFEIRLQGVEKTLDFSKTSAALSFLAFNSRSIFRFDIENGIFQLAWDGLPVLQEMQVDAKKDLDAVLKHACIRLKQNSLKMLIPSIAAFISKVTAFVGDIPAGEKLENNNTVGFESVKGLKGQSFMRPERIKEVIDSDIEIATQEASDLREIMKLYIDNPIARSILMKPVQYEIELLQKRMEYIFFYSVDLGQSKREFEQNIKSLFSTIVSELTR